MNEHPPTPKLTQHARERCEEMGLNTKQAKRVVQDPEITYEGNHCGETIAISGDLAVPFVVQEDGVPRILTVLWHGIEFERQNG